MRLNFFPVMLETSPGRQSEPIAKKGTARHSATTLPMRIRIAKQPLARLERTVPRTAKFHNLNC